MALTPSMALFVIALFAVLSFFCALAETALFSLGKWQVQRLAEQSGMAGKTLASLLGKPQDLLATIVLGNTLANATMVSLGLWMTLRGDWPMGITVAALLVLILVGCEVVPKTLAVRLPERWALRVAQPMAWMQWLTSPMRQMAQWLDTVLLRLLVSHPGRAQTVSLDEEYQELLELAFQQGTLAKSEKEIILQIISLDRSTVREVMRPRSQMACISDDSSIEEMVAAARRFKHRRLPLYDETPDTIVGVLNTRTLLLDPQVDLVEAIEFPSFVPASMNLLQLLKSLQRQQRGLAIVLDEYGGTAGLVTMEDILEEIIGEIRSEGEQVGFVMEKLGEGRWRVNGTMRLDDFHREYPELGDVPEVETMGGLVSMCLERVPEAGQSTVFRGLRLTVLAADERRVREMLVELLPKRTTS
ncbi:MAG: hemolysin family protein [Candidatus Omnitrophica bacterium]|nr:hemolysin family protein [Candidatus Omnitrophota bacterium]